MYPGTYSRTQPDKVAVIYATTGERVTYAQLDERSNQKALRDQYWTETGAGASAGFATPA